MVTPCPLRGHTLFVLFAFHVSFTIGDAMQDLADKWNEPTPAVTFDVPEPVPTNSLGEECIGEELPEGC